MNILEAHTMLLEYYLFKRPIPAELRNEAQKIHDNEVKQIIQIHEPKISCWWLEPNPDTSTNSVILVMEDNNGVKQRVTVFEFTADILRRLLHATPTKA